MYNGFIPRLLGIVPMRLVFWCSQDFGESIYCKEPEDVLGPIEVLSKKKGPLIKKGELLFKIQSVKNSGGGGGAAKESVTPCAYFLDHPRATRVSIYACTLLPVAARRNETVRWFEI